MTFRSGLPLTRNTPGGWLCSRPPSAAPGHWSLRSGRGAARPSDHAPTSGNLQRLLLYLEKGFQTPLSALRCGVGRTGAPEGLPPSPAPATPQPLLPAGSAAVTGVPAGAAPLGRQLCPEGPAGVPAATRQERPVPSALPSGLTLTASVSGHPSPSACQAHRVPRACPWGRQESLGGESAGLLSLGSPGPSDPSDAPWDRQEGTEEFGVWSGQVQGQQ